MAALLELAAWLAEHRYRYVVREATGVYWKLVWHILEEGFALVFATQALFAKCWLQGPR